MGDILGFIGGLVTLFVAGALAYMSIRGALRGLTAESARDYWFYFPLAVLFTVMAFRAAMLCLDLINIYFISRIIIFD